MSKTAEVEADAPVERKSVKHLACDIALAEAIQAERGLSMTDCYGVALEGWARLPRKVQDQIIRDRAQRRRGASD